MRQHSLKGAWLALALAAMMVPGKAWSQAEQQEAARAAIDEARNSFVEAYAAGDVEGVMSAYHPDATFGGTLEPYWLEGEDAIRELWTRYFEAWPTRKLIFRQPTVRLYDGVSSETGYLMMFMGDGQRTITTPIRYSITRVETKDGWRIVNMHVARLPGTR